MSKKKIVNIREAGPIGPTSERGDPGPAGCVEPAEGKSSNCSDAGMEKEDKSTVLDNMMNKDKVFISENDPTKPRFVFKIVTYLDECERRVQEKVFLEGEIPAGACAFSGAGIMLVKNPEDPKNPKHQVCNFDIPGAQTFADAFGLFETFWAQKLKHEGAESGIPEPKDAPFIVQVIQTLDNNLQRVQEHVAMAGTLPPKYPRYRGAGITRLPDGQEVIEEFILDGAETLLDAYKIFPSVAAEVARRTGEQYRQWYDRQMAALRRAEAEAEAAKGGKKIIVPEDKRGKNGPKGVPPSKLIIPG